MSKFGPAAFQAAQVMKQVQGKELESVGTVRNYEQALTRVAEYMDENRLGSLQDITVEQSEEYLKLIAQDKSQSSIDMQRQSIQVMMRYVTNKLDRKENLKRVFTENPTKLTGRSYSKEQKEVIAKHQLERNSLATEIAYSAGLRAHELLSLSRVSEQAADERPVSEHKFKGREGVRYTVKGKGGLCREVLMQKDLSNRLEEKRLGSPLLITDRGIHYVQKYEINGGKLFSNSFSQASNRAFGWSRGAHGLRHSYAQERVNELQCLGLSRLDALKTVSQEMGHFRPEIIEVYLR